MLLEAFKEEVVNGSKVVVATVLQGLGSRDSGSEQGPGYPGH